MAQYGDRNYIDVMSIEAVQEVQLMRGIMAAEFGSVVAVRSTSLASRAPITGMAVCSRITARMSLTRETHFRSTAEVTDRCFRKTAKSLTSLADLWEVQSGGIERFCSSPTKGTANRPSSA
jgi:hypothetical protein